MNYTFLDEYKLYIPEETFLSNLISQFYAFAVKYYKNTLDRRTLYTYIRNIEGFEKFIYYQYPNLKCITELSEEHLLSFKSFCLNGLNNNKKTINTKLTALRYFFKYLSDNNYIKYNIALNVNKFKYEENHYPKIFKLDQLKILFSEMRKIPFGLRDVVISKIILCIGLEIKDVLSLKISNIDLDSSLILYKDKEYPISGELLKEIKEYLNIRNELLKTPTTTLFLSREGTEYSIRSYQLFFKKALINTNIPLDMSPRYLRTTFLFNMSKIANEEELHILTQQKKLNHYYKLNPLQNLI